MSAPLSKSAIKRAPTPPPPSPPHILEAENDDEETAVTSGRKPRVGSLSKLATPPISPGVPNSNVHERFLAAPSQSLNPSVSVNTLKESYEIAVRFEEIGMRRDGITLSTRRRRVLHIQADDYGATGGHWERRIGFGWDADLKNVRAEFDGAMLRVLVPRKKGSGIGGTVGGAASHL
jgi:HSP20 family molecular chaperone IbpA